MSVSDLITVNECCELLKISRPTLNQRRSELGLEEVSVGRNVFLKRAEVLNKLYTQQFPVKATVNLALLQQSFDITETLIDANTVDLRRINLIDPYGVISLFCYVLEKLKRQENFFFINQHTPITGYLNIVGFFKELIRKFPNLVHLDKSNLVEIDYPQDLLRKILLPLREITYKGQERKVTEELLMSLLKEGFSEDRAGYIGWIIGELSDNSLTHAKGACYIMVSRFIGNGSSGFIEIAVGDVGVGVYESLRNNKKYKLLNNKQAFLKAFQSGVSSWPDEAERGKGLCDLLTIAYGNNGFVRADSNELGLFFNFGAGQRGVEFHQPLTAVKGSRFSVILFEKDFKSSQRSEIDSFLDSEIKKHE